MFKKVTGFLLILVLTFAVTACGNSGVNDGSEVSETEIGEDGKQYGPTLTKVMEQGKIVMGTDADYPPFVWLGEEDGETKVIGFDVALAQAIADELEVELEVVDMDFKGILPALSLNELDFSVAEFVPTEERRQQVDFSDVYYTGGQGVLIRKEDEDKYKTQEDFDGARVSAQQATIQEELAKGLEGAEADFQVNLNNIVMELKGNAIDAAVIAELPGKNFAKLNDELIYVDVGFPNEDGTAVAVAKGNEDFLEVINKVIAEWKETGEVEKQIEYYADLVNRNLEENN